MSLMPPPIDPELAAAVDLDSLRITLTHEVIGELREVSAPMPTLDQLRRGGAFTVEERIAHSGSGGSAGVPLLLCRPIGVTGRPPVLYHLHGGGMVMGHARQHLDYVLRWAEELRAAVVSVEYRLAQEHPYPAALDDAAAGMAWHAAHSGGAVGGIRQAGTSGAPRRGPSTCLQAASLVARFQPPEPASWRAERVSLRSSSIGQTSICPTGRNWFSSRRRRASPAATAPPPLKPTRRTRSGSTAVSWAGDHGGPKDKKPVQVAGSGWAWGGAFGLVRSIALRSCLRNACCCARSPPATTVCPCPSGSRVPVPGPKASNGVWTPPRSRSAGSDERPGRHGTAALPVSGTGSRAEEKPKPGLARSRRTISRSGHVGPQGMTAPGIPAPRLSTDLPPTPASETPGPIDPHRVGLCQSHRPALAPSTRTRFLAPPRVAWRRPSTPRPATVRPTLRPDRQDETQRAP
ncbi:hypothetical protein QFZ63_001198 [Streptomyces sp. B3I7]|nr:hypothetical protein [Streptomyces sp. B3I7]